MSHPFAFICPVCDSEDSIVATKCTHCDCEINISATGIQSRKGGWTLDYYLNWMKKTISVKQNQDILKKRNRKIQSTLKDPVWRISQKAVLRQGVTAFNYRCFGGLFKRELFFPRALHEGVLVISAEYFYFCFN